MVAHAERTQRRTGMPVVEVEMQRLLQVAQRPDDRHRGGKGGSARCLHLLDVRTQRRHICLEVTDIETGMVQLKRTPTLGDPNVPDINTRTHASTVANCLMDRNKRGGWEARSIFDEQQRTWPFGVQRGIEMAERRHIRVE